MELKKIEEIRTMQKQDLIIYLNNIIKEAQKEMAEKILNKYFPENYECYVERLHMDLTDISEGNSFI